MSEFRPTNPPETPSGIPASDAISEPSTAASSDAGAMPTTTPGPSPEGSASAPRAEQAREPRVRRLLENRKRRWIVVAAAAMCAVIGISVGLATSGSPTTAQPAAATGAAAGSVGGRGSAGGASNARSGPATGGASGTISSVSASSFTMTTSAGQKVTVDEASSTTYQNGPSSISANAMTTGDSVLALGMTNGTTITASQVILQPNGSDGPAASAAAGVVPFQQGAPTTSKQVGQIPASYIQGSGTIVSGTTANEATEAALAAYPGGVVDRVVQLSNGDYEVHYIGVNWPHHVFVNQAFSVIGAF